jgi:hypothetical protein
LYLLAILGVSIIFLIACCSDFKNTCRMRYNNLMRRHCWCTHGCKNRDNSLFDHRGNSKFIRPFHSNVLGDTVTVKNQKNQ